MGLYTSFCHGPVHLFWLHAALWPWTCILLVAMDLYTACGHRPVHLLWPWACTPLVAMDLYTGGCMQPFGHGPVHCLWLHAALWPWTYTLLVARNLYTACGHGPVHCLWLHAALWPWTWTCGHGPIHCLQPQPVPLHTSFVSRSPSSLLSLQLHSWKCAWHQLVNAISLNLNRVRTALQSPQYRQAPCSGLANPYKMFLKAFENIVEDTGVSRHVLSPRLQDVSDFMHRLHVLLPWHLL